MRWMRTREEVYQKIAELLISVGATIGSQFTLLKGLAIHAVKNDDIEGLAFFKNVSLPMSFKDDVGNNLLHYVCDLP